MDYPQQPTSDELVITSPHGGSPYDPDSIQVFNPQHLGVTRSADRGTLQVGSHHCSGCGERQTELMIIGNNGKALYVKLRPSMAIALGEVLMIHGKAGQVQQ